MAPIHRWIGRLSRPEPDRHAGRRDQPDHLGPPDRRGGHDVDIRWRCPRRSRRMGCSARSTPTAGRTISIRPKPAEKVDKRIRRRSAAPWGSSAFATFHPTRPRRGGGWNVCSGTLKQRLGLARTRRSTSLEFNGRALADRDGWCHRRYSVHADLGGCGVRPGCQRQRGRSGLAARAWPFIPQPKSADIAALSRGRIGQRVEPRQDMTQHE